MNYQKIREEAYVANIRIVEAGLVLLTWGNASVADHETGVFAIKPSGVAYEDLSAESMVVVDIMSGDTVEGDLKPSSDTDTHAELYRAFDRIGAIVHTHSHYAVCFAQVPQSIPILGTTHADHFRHAIPVTRDMTEEEVTGAYELNTGKVIVECFRSAGISDRDVPGVLVARHGPFAWGSTGTKAVDNAIVLEEVARMGMHTAAIAPDITGAPPHLTEKHFTRKHGPQAYYGQSGNT
ncbi:MAG: L-ribulose-5-phosphate 4-epimerase AraD [Spirochaetaceae bacterium]|nr:MAG: L-ribulose-5-phosphate 4-epimerase AraD [Spirochaetaceae bacterium]